MTRGSTRSKAWVMGQEGRYVLTWVSVWIKIIIIIVLKPDAGVNPEQSPSNGLGEST
jgi:hypothetical protein